ncbi:uncharacterized protein EV420DRAFT_1637234 [Desarmillaria tabescens]|uniref:Uncharacterized protein n=1 Tax=Armillaria tabescens TaxID=1929756 RepID=A0AA39NG76_ARMTA|nr:uncharacterized protein EV420DRAFT_1637234 [Desarmillaria tabescens]KAK0465067.1 hypothetical protein EV420DRAFT_1637234 [Desarmillaria tabescens]
MSSRKRKSRQNKSSHHGSHLAATSDISPSANQLFIQAYEADIIRGSRAKSAAESLQLDHAIGDGLIRLGEPGNDADESESLWVDRYDARLLLYDIDAERAGRSSLPESPGGWSDLPSDTEDTFFFSPEEADDYHREKKRRLNDEVREERLRARLAEEEDERWGGSDEEPEESVKEVMRRTAKLILSAANPTQMEMKVLVDFGDKQPAFAFMKGRWSRVWKTVKAATRLQLAEEETRRNASTGLGGLADYGDSDAESSDAG